MANGNHFVKNHHLEEIDDDVLYHFGFHKNIHDFVAMFGDVKVGLTITTFVFCSGSATRIESLAKKLQEQFPNDRDVSIKNLSLTDRYCMYKVGPMLCVNHGMGGPSISIMLVEVLKMLRYAQCQDVTFFRLGTCGGLGLTPGSVVITKDALNGSLERFHIQFILGKKVERPILVDQNLVKELMDLSVTLPYQVVAGVTVCADDFYEGQGRLDGAFCEYENEDKLRFLHCLHDEKGVRNVEMETSCFFAMLHRAGVKAAAVAVTLLDRLKSDQIRTEIEILKEWEDRPTELLIMYLKNKFYDDNANELKQSM